MIRTTPLLLTILAGVAATAVAAPSGNGALPDFEMVDTDGDASVTRTEAKASEPLIARFDRIDLNRDGQLDEQEYREAAAAAPPER